MKIRTLFNLLFCLALSAALGYGADAAAQCMGFTCTITGTSAGETIFGTSGADVICALGGNDTVSGGGGNDKICGGSGDDVLNGGNGNDLIDGENGADTIDGDADSDTAVFSFAIIASLESGSTNNGDSLIEIEGLTGSSGNDELTGNGGANTLIGQGGNDKLTGKGGADTLNGGNGTDTAAYDTAITVSLATGSASDGDTLTAIENLTGSSSGDSLTGDGNNNVLDGGAGVDTLDGQGGTDTCTGGLPIGPPPDFDDPDTCTGCESATGCSVQ